jgi:hypothetical protein
MFFGALMEAALIAICWCADAEVYDYQEYSSTAYVIYGTFE